MNPVPPAPVSAGHMEAGLKAGRAVWANVARLQSVATDPFVSAHAMAPGHESWIGTMLYAPDENGEWIPFLDMHGGGAGLGAQVERDGLDAGGTLSNAINQLPDIETIEHHATVLYLWRKLGRGTGGVGRFRGGQGIEVAWTPWGTVGGQTTTFAATQQVPATGLFGGFPGSGSRHRLIRGADVHATLRGGSVPGTVDELGGERIDYEAKRFNAPVDAGDVMQVRLGGGGGFGDPLLRDPDAVARDARDGYADPGTLDVAYGVVLDGEDVDAEATVTLRERIRADRRAWPVLGDGSGIPAPRSEAERVANPGLTVDDDGTLHCTSCAEAVAPAGTDYHACVPADRRPAAEVLTRLGAWTRLRADVDVAQFACPGCGALLDVRVVVTHPDADRT